MRLRQTNGSVVCPRCRRLVGVNDDVCHGCGMRRPGLWGFAPLLSKLGQDLGFTWIVIWGCGILFALSLFLDPPQTVYGGGFSILPASGGPLFQLGMSGAVPVFQEGRWWTVLSAAWLHGNLLHIGMNLLWIRQLAPAVAHYYGAGRLVIIYTISSIFGFLLSSSAALLPLPDALQGAYFTVGASAPLFGLFGALYYYGKRTDDNAMSSQFGQFLIIWLLIGVMSGLGEQNSIRIDNWAHLGGFLGGLGAAWGLDPLKREKIAHQVVALVLIPLPFLAVVVSYFDAP